MQRRYRICCLTKNRTNPAYVGAQIAAARLAALRILEGEAVPEVITLSAEVIGRENAAAWDCPYEERPLPEWGAVRGS